MATVYWDLVAACNAGCVYCSAWQARRDAAVAPMPLGSALRILDHLRTAGAESIILLGGEPTLHPDLLGIARGAVARGFDIGIATNGLAWEERLREDLLTLPGVSLNVSLDSFFEDENDAVRGSGYTRRALATLRDLLEQRPRLASRARITVQMTLTRVNLAHLRESIRRLVALGVDGVLVDRMRTFAWHTPAVRQLALSPEEWVRGAVYVAQAAREHRDHAAVVLNYGQARLRSALRARFAFPETIERRCPGGYEAAVLGLDGRLHPCRASSARAIPLRPDGSPRYERRPIEATDPAAAAAFESPYFTSFFNFAHAASTYDGLETCATCCHYMSCEPCPLDVAGFGKGAVPECLWLETHPLPGE